MIVVNKKMKLCIIASGDYFSSYGGGQIYVKNLVRSLIERGHDVSVISLSVVSIDQPTTHKRIVDGINVIQLKLSQNGLHVKQPFELQPYFIDALKNVIDDIQPDIVHAHGWKYATSKVCDSLSVPCVITAHHGGIVCPNGMLLNNHDAICSVDVSMKNCLSCALHFVPAGDLFAPIISSISKESALKIATFLKSKRNIPYVSPAFQTLDIPFNQQGYYGEKISIGNNVWIGSGSFISSSVQIGDNVVIGAGSFISKSIPSNSKVYSKKELIIKELY